jgi:thiol-disulfide isomerase/thioredoxin
MKIAKIALVFIIFAGAFAYFSVLNRNKVTSESETKTVKLLNDQAREFSLPSWEGKELSLNSVLGNKNFVLVNFWATWCEPCIREIPTFIDLKKNLKDQPFEIVAVNVAEDWGKIKSFFKDKFGGKPSFEILLDKDSSVVTEWETTKFPETYLVAPNGKILNKFIGEVPWNAKKFEKYLLPIMKKYNEVYKK